MTRLIIKICGERKNDPIAPIPSDQNISLLTFEEMCPLPSVLIVEYLYIFAQFSPVFVLFVIQKYHLPEIL